MHKQSSDDFWRCISYSDSSWSEARRQSVISILEDLRLLWWLVGINISPQKTFYFINLAMGELTSLYHDTFFRGNFSVELPGMIPQGVDPISDVSLFSKNLHISLVREALGFPAASFMIKLWFKFYNFVYEQDEISIQSRLSKAIREKYGTNVMSANGGVQIYSPSTIGFSEIAMRLQNPGFYPSGNILPMNNIYLSLILFNGDAQEDTEVDYINEGKRIESRDLIVPHQAYRVPLRRNEKVNNRTDILERERDARKKLNIVTSIDPFFSLNRTKDFNILGNYMFNSIVGRLSTLERSPNFSGDTTELWDRLREIALGENYQIGLGKLS